jgi:Protein of unknown function (DUF2911)
MAGLLGPRSTDWTAALSPQPAEEGDSVRPTHSFRAVLAAGAFILPALAPHWAAADAVVVPTTNALAVVKQRVAATDIEVTYHRPSVKGRKIFGGLVPYGHVWRTGSDNATRISFDTPLKLNGVAIDAGTYELFTIPGETEWTVVIHQDKSQWGAYSYDPANDVARVTANPVSLSDPVESFTIDLSDIRSSAATLNIAWERTRVPMHIEIDVRATAVPKVEAALQAPGRKPYFAAAMFYFENDLDIERAAELIAQAIAQSPGHVGMLHRQALILAKKGDRAGAMAAAEKSLAGAKGSPSPLREEYERLNNALLEELRRQ